MTIFVTRGVEQVGRLDDVDLRVRRLDDGEHVAREDCGGWRSSTSRFCSSSSIWRRAAEMNRSTGAPASICFCSSPDEPKLYRSVTPGRLAMKPRPSSSTASFMLIATESSTS